MRVGLEGCPLPRLSSLASRPVPGLPKTDAVRGFQRLGTSVLGTPFTYDIRFERNVLMASVNGQMKALTTYLTLTAAMFNIGNHNQGTDDASAHIFEFLTDHGGDIFDI